MALEKSFDFNTREAEIYSKWEELGIHKSDVNSSKPSICLMMPPPSVTGNLHCGHAMEDSITDIYTRFMRATGYNVLWQPGLDHAGIATQLMVERKVIAEQGKTKHDLGREALLEEIWKWKEESGGTILAQLRKLGATPDWSRERFTLDAGLSKAVRKVFVKLYNEGLINKGERLVNWDITLQTAVSDLEVENQEIEGKMYYFNYPIDGKSNEGQFITIATTRPETMFGDSGIAIHPENEKLKHFIGKHAILPFMNRELPIIADEYADPNKGTGAVKLTPAHDFNDFELGKRHGLQMISIMDTFGKLNDKCPAEFQGLDRLEARTKVIEKMKALGLFIKEEKHVMSIPYGERSKEVIEPMLTYQWFVDMKEMAAQAVALVQKNETELMPKYIENTYFHFLNNIQEWCISRQLWWGHRIPAFYGSDGACFVAENEEDALIQAVSHYGKSADEITLTQDNDVLDTWFSSALWPFTTLGWDGDEASKHTQELEKYYPTTLLITGRDLTFFWLSRMIMIGKHITGQSPFKKVFLHGLVNDEKGKKMSKSKGNGVDPLELINKYGADALRFYFASATTQGNDIALSEKQIEGYRNFTTKIWNACKFIEFSQQFEGKEFTKDENFKPENVKETSNKWILEELKTTREKIEKSLKDLRFNDSTTAIYDFAWKTFCDWFIEISKANGSDENNQTLLFVRDEILKLLHPFMPFITEEIWQNSRENATCLATEIWTEYKWNFKNSVEKMESTMDLIGIIRSMKVDLNISPAKFIDINIAAAENINDLKGIIEKLARVNIINKAESNKTIAIPTDKFDAKIILNENIELDVAKMQKDLSQLQGAIKSAESRFSNENFVKNAPAQVLSEQKLSHEQNIIKAKKLEEIIEKL